jgi:hypothetical protein
MEAKTDGMIKPRALAEGLFYRPKGSFSFTSNFGRPPYRTAGSNELEAASVFKHNIN